MPMSFTVWQLRLVVEQQKHAVGRIDEPCPPPVGSTLDGAWPIARAHPNAATRGECRSMARVVRHLKAVDIATSWMALTGLGMVNGARCARVRRAD
jgi:hypothetical protein